MASDVLSEFFGMKSRSRSERKRQKLAPEATVIISTPFGIGRANASSLERILIPYEWIFSSVGVDLRGCRIPVMIEDTRFAL